MSFDPVVIRSVVAGDFLNEHAAGESGLEPWAEGEDNFDEASFQAFAMGLLIGLHHRDDAAVLLADFKLIDGVRALDAINEVVGWVVRGAQPGDGPIALALQERRDNGDYPDDEDDRHDDDRPPPVPPTPAPTARLLQRLRTAVSA